MHKMQSYNRSESLLKYNAQCRAMRFSSIATCCLATDQIDEFDLAPSHFGVVR